MLFQAPNSTENQQKRSATQIQPAKRKSARRLAQTQVIIYTYMI